MAGMGGLRVGVVANHDMALEATLCFAAAGHRVTCVHRDEERVQMESQDRRPQRTSAHEHGTESMGTP